MHSTIADYVEVVKSWQCEKSQPFANSYVLKGENSTQHFLLSFMWIAKPHLEVHPMVSWSTFDSVFADHYTELCQAFPRQRRAHGGVPVPSASSLPAELSVVWHQPGLLRALTLTHHQHQPPGLPQLAVGAAGAARCPWAVEGLGGVAEVGAPQMKQGSQQRHWGGQVEALGLKCRE